MLSADWLTVLHTDQTKNVCSHRPVHCHWLQSQHRVRPPLLQYRSRQLRRGVKQWQSLQDARTNHVQMPTLHTALSPVCWASLESLAYSPATPVTHRRILHNSRQPITAHHLCTRPTSGIAQKQSHSVTTITSPKLQLQLTQRHWFCCSALYS